MKKKVLALALALIMIFSVNTTVYANVLSTYDINDQNKIAEMKNEEIKNIIDKLGEVRVDQQLQIANQSNERFSSRSYNDIENNLEKQLFNLGVEEISVEDIVKLSQNDSNISPMAGVPNSTDSIKCYSYTYTYTYNNVKYNVQEVYTQGVDANSALANLGDGVPLYTDRQVAVANLKNIASIYAQKGIGLIPIVQWLPYELLFSNNSRVTNNSHLVTYRSLSTVCFTYVRPYDESDFYEVLTFVSNSVHLSSIHIFAGFDNGMPYTRSSDEKVNTFRAERYAPLLDAVKAYADVTAARSSFVSYYVFYNEDMTKSLTQYVVNPSFPLQLF